MSNWLAERWRLLTSILDRPWLRVGAIIWAAISAYDLLASQLLPAWLAEQLPKVREVIGMTSGWLPWWAWGWIGTALLAAAAVEYAARLREATKPVRQVKLTPLQLYFEPVEPWVRRIPDARTPLPSDPSISVKTDSLWFHVQVINGRPAHIIQGVRVFITNVQLLQNGDFRDIGFGTQRELRWANESAKPFDPRDIHHLEKHYIDVLSVDEVRNKVFVSWPDSPRWLTYEKLFDIPGIYKLSLIATSAGGDGAMIDLNLAWPGKWDQVGMWLDDLPASIAKARECLWQAFHDGVDLRNAGQESMLSPESIAWDKKFFAWREIALGFSGCLSSDLKHHLQTMNHIDPKNAEATIYVSVASEMLARIQKFLTKDL